MSADTITADEKWMRHALALARRSEASDEVPVGAVLVRDGEVLGEGWNRPISSNDPTAHAEMVALREGAGRAGNYRLPGSTLYVTLEPCTMCAGALVHARVERLVFGAREEKQGSVVSRARVLDNPALNHRVEVAGDVLASECGEVISAFFRARREAGLQRTPAGGGGGAPGAGEA